MSDPASPTRLEDVVRSRAPASLLDVGCGCGHLTRALATHCAGVFAIDLVPHPSRWEDLARAPGISFCRMDATALGFADGSFPLVLERASLHHIARWPEAVAEMARVSSAHLLIQEPADDLRSEAKHRTHEAQGLFLDLQAEVDFPHHRHLDRDALLSVVESRARPVGVWMDLSDEPIAFEQFFDSFGAFAARSAREAYWLEELRRLRSRFDGAPLCQDDTLTILAAKEAPGLPL
jgi:SAM-dependent methyltransferase